MAAVQDRIYKADRRKYRRFRVPADAFAIIKRPRFKLGQILDVSMGGIALCYLDHLLKFESLQSIDMLLADNGFYLPRIKAALMWDAPYQLIGPEDAAPMRQCGIKFDGLTPMQQAKLTFFIPRHADGFVYDRRYSAG